MKFFSNLSVRLRLTLTLVFMALMVVVISGMGFWFINQMDRSMAASLKGLEQVEQVNELHTSFLSITSFLDHSLLTRQSLLVEKELNVRANDFSLQMAALQQITSIENSPSQAQKESILAYMIVLGQELNGALTDISSLVEEGRWARAQVVRHTVLSSLQRRLEENLADLSAAVQQDVDFSNAQTARSQSLARLYWIAVAAGIFLFALVMSFLTSRSIVRPIRILGENVKRVTFGDFSPVPPLAQRDEVGDLSRSFALMTGWLRESYEQLEQRVAERTHDLERRTLQVRVASEVARDVIANRDPVELLTTSVELIRDRFGFYHAGLFLLDETGEWAVLQAATGDAGRELLSRHHRLRVSSKTGGAGRASDVGIVGHVAGSGEPRIAQDVGADAAHFRNPLLPETRSEMAVPLKTGNQVIGVLDVQSRTAQAFDQEDVTVLQILADQLVVALQNAHLMQEAEQNLRLLEASYSDYGKTAWEAALRSRVVYGYQYDRGNLSPILSQEVATEAESAQQPISIPLKVRDSVIGALEVWPHQEGISEEQVRLIQAITERVSQSLESARMYEETQSQAARERIINQLSAGFARSLEVDSVLQAAVQELGRLPSVTEAAVYVGLPQASLAKAGGNGAG